MAIDLKLGRSATAYNIDDALPFGLLPYRTIAAIALLAHLTCLWLVGDLLGGRLALAQTLSALAASTCVYVINAAQTAWQRGPWRWYLGLLPFLASCGFGNSGSLLLAIGLANQGMDEFAAGLCGAVFGLWWNEGAASRHGWADR